MSQTVRPGPRNLITDVPGIKVGNAHSEQFATGVTVVLPDGPAVAGVDVRGGAPGTRDVAALDPTCLVDQVEAIVLAGGSVFGLDAAGAVTAHLSEMGRGLTFAGQPKPVPVVPSAILFDLAFGPDKHWGTQPPYRGLGGKALENAGMDFSLGNEGAGFGATAGTLKGGLGSASVEWDGYTVGALVAANPIGTCIDPRTGDLWARPFELGGEFGPGPSTKPSQGALPAPLEGSKLTAREPAANTTLGVVATDAPLTKAQATRLSIMAADGMARAVRPVHSPFDGDTVFAISTGESGASDITPEQLAALGTLAADCLTRAIGAGIASAETLHGWPAWKNG